MNSTTIFPIVILSAHRFVLF